MSIEDVATRLGRIETITSSAVVVMSIEELTATVLVALTS